MSTIIRLIPAFIVFCAVGWFVGFQYNPSYWCEDHPNPELKDEYYLCQPFSFDLRKGVIDRPRGERNPWEDQYVPIRKKTVPKKSFDCSNSDVLMTQEGYDYCIGNTK